jgi:hypothetical protein
MRRLVADKIVELGAVAAVDFRSNMSQLYFGYSDYSYPTDLSLRVLVRKEGEEYQLRLGGEYHRELLLQSTDMFCHAAELLFTLLYPLIPDHRAAAEAVSSPPIVIR